MRDPSRIPQILARIAEVWKLQPDIRLGQLLCNVIEYDNMSQLFNIEDDLLALRLEVRYAPDPLKLKVTNDRT